MGFMVKIGRVLLVVLGGMFGVVGLAGLLNGQMGENPAVLAIFLIGVFCFMLGAMTGRKRV